MSIPYISTLAWIESMNFTIEEDWRPWFSNDQVAGFVSISVNLVLAFEDLEYIKS